ncbi:MAG: outer membrane lipid asymmetry maintenance protein MlaD [Gammaproteobacteria bacterium]
MLSQKTIESFVGIFVLAAMTALLVLAFKVSGLTSFFKPEGYYVTAEFDEIGQLKVRAPVTIGEVTGIKLEPQSYKANVTMLINSKMHDIPVDSSASILTAGLLGDNYIAITPMYSNDSLKEGSQIQETHPAMILEKLIGQVMYKLSNPNKTDNKVADNTSKGVQQ